MTSSKKTEVYTLKTWISILVFITNFVVITGTFEKCLHAKPGKECAKHEIDSGIVVQGNKVVPTETVTTKFNLKELQSNPVFQAIKAFEHARSFANCFLFTRTNPQSSHLLAPGNIPLVKTSNFNPLVNTKIIIHGFYDNMYESSWMMKMKDNLLATADWNVILVDWSCCNELPYSNAIANVPVVAEGIKNLILFLQLVTGIKPELVHVIGHCLGSHIAGLVGRGLQKLGRITALNPLGLSVVGLPPSLRLIYSDAVFVDCIHTAFAEGINPEIPTPVGHIDFFPNEGKKQPGCQKAHNIVVTQGGDVVDAQRYMTCDHFRATVYFMESITPNFSCVAIGVSCKDWESFNNGLCSDCQKPGSCFPMGFPTGPYVVQSGLPKKRLNVYLKTSATSPFCVFQNEVMFEKATDQKAAIQIELTVAGNETVPIVLPARKPTVTNAGGQPVFLIITKVPLAKVLKAKMLWSTNETALVQNRIHFVPIMLPGSAGFANTVLCLAQGQKPTINNIVHLKVNQC